MSGQVYAVPFAQIPEWILDAEISDRAVRLFCVLHRHANENGRAFPGRSSIAKRMRCSTPSIDRALTELRDIGAVVSVQKKVGPAIVGNDYWLWPAAPSSPVTSPSVTGDASVASPVSALVASPVTRQEEREPGNESQVERDNALVVVADNVTRVFDAWQSSTGKTRAVLDAKRRSKITNALKRFDVDELIDAVRGWQHSPYHCGENEHGTVYNDLDLLLRDAKHVEQFRDWERGLNRPTPRGQRNGKGPVLSKSFQNVEAVFNGMRANQGEIGR